jgi:uncharacterized protein DUF4112
VDDKARDDGERAARGQRGLERLRAITRLFDQAFGIPGTRWRFGIDALFGLVPGLGDVTGAVVAIYALHVARIYRVPASIQLHMLSNIAIDALVGTIPLLGDVFDFFYKAQTRNLALLENWLASPEDTRRRSRRGLLLLPLTILLVFTTLTILGVWMLYLFFSWLMSFGS